MTDDDPLLGLGEQLIGPRTCPGDAAIPGTVRPSDVADILRRVTVGAVASEDDVQAVAAAVLRDCGLDVTREHRLGPRDRLDLFVAGIAVEVKVTGRVPDVVRQLARYASHDEVLGLVLLTTRRRLIPDPDIARNVLGKPLEVVVW